MSEPLSAQGTTPALLVVDMQNDVVAAAYGLVCVVGNIARLVATARENGVPVIWVRHADDELVPGTRAWQIIDGLEPVDGEAIVEKHYGDAFEGTELEAMLSRLRVRRLFVTGAQSDACVRATLHGAFARGYDVILVSDAHTTEDRGGDDMPSARQVIALTNRYWGRHAAPGRSASTVETKDVIFGAAFEGR